MQIIYKKLNEIRPYENNPRNNDKAVKFVANSINEFGFKVPIVIDKNGIIVAGHTRYRASQELGLKEVPCIIADDLDEEKIKAFRLADNRVGEIAEWDDELLKLELGDIDLDMSDFGFDIEMQEEEKQVEEDYYNVDENIPEEPKAKPGDIYQLGNHRLMCGDSTKAEDVQKLMDGKEADLVVTDPPYNVDYEGKTKEALKIENDKMTNQVFQDFLNSSFFNMNEALKCGGGFYIWHASRTQREFENALNNVGLEVRQQLIWNKNCMVLGRQDYQWKHEPCFYGWKEGKSHYFINDRTKITVQEINEELEKKNKKELLEILKEIIDKTNNTIINENKPSRSLDHPTMKPIKLIARSIQNSSRPGEIVLDLFGGSGSTLMAAEQLDRTCYTMEYDPKYVDVIINRWEEYTGEKAEKIN